MERLAAPEKESADLAAAGALGSSRMELGSGGAAAAGVGTRLLAPAAPPLPLLSSFPLIPASSLSKKPRFLCVIVDRNPNSVSFCGSVSRARRRLGGSGSGSGERRRTGAGAGAGADAAASEPGPEPEPAAALAGLLERDADADGDGADGDAAGSGGEAAPLMETASDCQRHWRRLLSSSVSVCDVAGVSRAGRRCPRPSLSNECEAL